MNSFSFVYFVIVAKQTLAAKKTKPVKVQVEKARKNHDKKMDQLMGSLGSVTKMYCKKLQMDLKKAEYEKGKNVQSDSSDDEFAE